MRPFSMHYFQGCELPSLGGLVSDVPQRLTQVSVQELMMENTICVLAV